MSKRPPKGSPQQYFEFLDFPPPNRSRASGYSLKREHRLRGPVVPIACVECGQSFLPNHRSRVICSAECAKRRDRRTRGATHIERAKAKGSAYKHWSTTRIYERDGWHCAVCRVATPRALKGTGHDHAPELDHWVPIAAGGPHLHWNVVLLCRTCNAVKGAAVLPVPGSILNRLDKADRPLLTQAWMGTMGWELTDAGQRAHACMIARGLTEAHRYAGRHCPWAWVRGDKAGKGTA